MIVRRAKIALGTLVEVGAEAEELSETFLAAAFSDAFRAVAEVEAALSRFDPQSDIARFNAAPAGFSLAIREDTATVLRAADELFLESGGLFDISQGSGPRAWSLSATGMLTKLSDEVRLDLGGIGKGHAVDRAFEALSAALCGAPCWVNAGGDLRVDALELPVLLRDEELGSARPWMILREGALATSYFGAGARSQLSGNGVAQHVSVAAPRCLWSDALTKIAALAGAGSPVLARHGATAFVHA